MFYCQYAILCQLLSKFIPVRIVGGLRNFFKSRFGSVACVNVKLQFHRQLQYQVDSFQRKTDDVIRVQAAQ